MSAIPFLAFVSDDAIAGALVQMALSEDGKQRIKDIAKKAAWINPVAAGVISTAFDTTKAHL